MKRELWYSIVIRDRHGKIVSRERRKSKSFLRAWNDIICAQVTGASGYLKRIDGDDTRGISPFADNFKMTSGYVNGAENEKSIVVGSGNTAVTISDYALETLIAHGAGAGQLSYQAATVNESIVSAPNCGFLVERAFVNNSGAEITAREAGIYLRIKGPTYYGFCCGVRDVFGTPQAIPNGGSLSVNYTLRVTA
ncbi:hypothetical protein ES703_119693 [subsurface metagenome]